MAKIPAKIVAHTLRAKAAPWDMGLVWSPDTRGSGESSSSRAVKEARVHSAIESFLYQTSPYNDHQRFGCVRAYPRAGIVRGSFTAVLGSLAEDLAFTQ